jgi:hypothetical protein
MVRRPLGGVRRKLMQSLSFTDVSAWSIHTFFCYPLVKNGITHLHHTGFTCRKINVIFLASSPESPRLTPWTSVLIAALLTGCGGSDVQVYNVAKDPAAQSPAKALPAANASAAAHGLPTLDWKVPQGWDEAAAGEMRYASFKVKGDAGGVADVGVFPLPGMAGGDLENVNRWRGQVGQPAITEEQRAKEAIPVTIDGQLAQVYEMAGENPGSGEKTRILAGILRKDGVAWFFKMTGPDALVASQKDPFVGWLSSIKFETTTVPELPPSHPPIDAAALAAQASAPATASSGAKPEWKVPAGWQETAGGQFLVAKFNIAGPDNSTAAVNVSMSTGDGGGLVSNVNRWRRQLGLGELADAEIQKLVTAVDLSQGKGSVVDMTGTDAKTGQKTRVIGGMVPRQGQTWFYKLMGPEQLVEREKASFLNFLQTTKYPDA